MKRTPGFKLKFPVLNNVEYFDVIKERKNVLTFGSEINGKSWRDLQIELGKELPPGVYHYSFKQKDSNEIHRGNIKAVNSMANKKEITHPDELILKQKIEMLTTQLNEMKAGNMQSQSIIELTKQGMQMQIDFKEQQLKAKDNEIKKLEDEIEKLTKLVDGYEQQVDDLNGKTGMNQYIELGLKLLNRFDKKTPPVNLASSEQTDIPPELLQILGVVDWGRVDYNAQMKIIDGIKKYISFLPLKGVHHGETQNSET